MFGFIRKLAKKNSQSPEAKIMFNNNQFSKFGDEILPEPSLEDIKRQEIAQERGYRLFKISTTCNNMTEWLRNVRAMEDETGWKVPGSMMARASQDAMASCRLSGARAKAKIDKHMSNGGRIARASRNATRKICPKWPPL